MNWLHKIIGRIWFSSWGLGQRRKKAEEKEEGVCEKMVGGELWEMPGDLEP